MGLTTTTGAHRIAMLDHGQYVFDAVEPGQYVLEFRKPGFKHADVEVTLRSSEPEHRQDIRVEDAWTIALHIVTPEGEDFRSAIAKARIGFHMQPAILTTTDPPGDHLAPSMLLDRTNQGLSLSATPNLEITETRDERIYVLVEPPVYVSVLLRDQVLATQHVQDRVGELTFVLDIARFRSLLGGITVRLVDGDTGLPPTEAGVCLTTDQSMESETRPDEQGVVRFQDRTPGLYEMHARAKGFAREIRKVEIARGATVDLGTITFVRGVGVRGRCVDRDGTPRRVPAGLVPLSDGPGESRSTMSYLVRIDEQGTFELKSLPAGRYALRVTSSLPGVTDSTESGWSAVPLLVDTTHGPVENVVLVVQRPTAVTLRPVGDAGDGLRFHVRTPEGLSCTTGTFAGAEPQRIELAPGEYALRLDRGEKFLRDVPFTVASEPVLVDVNP